MSNLSENTKNRNTEVIQNTLLTLKVPRINCVLRKDQKPHRFSLQRLCLNENEVSLFCE